MTLAAAAARRHPGLAGLILCLAALTALSGCDKPPPKAEADASPAATERREGGDSDGGMGY